MNKFSDPFVIGIINDLPLTQGNRNYASKGRYAEFYNHPVISLLRFAVMFYSVLWRYTEKPTDKNGEFGFQ